MYVGCASNQWKCSNHLPKSPGSRFECVGDGTVMWGTLSRVVVYRVSIHGLRCIIPSNVLLIFHISPYSTTQWETFILLANIDGESPPISHNSRRRVSLHKPHTKYMPEYSSLLNANSIFSIQFSHQCYETQTWAYSSARACVGTPAYFNRRTFSFTHRF
jgi:hypothetical protein